MAKRATANKGIAVTGAGAVSARTLSRGYSEADKARILRAYEERWSLRGLERTFGVARQTVAKWLKKDTELLKQYGSGVVACQAYLLPAQEGDELEVDAGALSGRMDVVWQQRSSDLAVDCPVPPHPSSRGVELGRSRAGVGAVAVAQGA